ncbi:MAG: hypothetical protein ACK4SI_05980 [Brevundimonas aurantiaca]|uniref:hypothetical protein n=1 Tax=Brevundimonas aurantiaca TaxID=74316 RepID=UPI00391B3919
MSSLTYISLTKPTTGPTQAELAVQNAPKRKARRLNGLRAKSALPNHAKRRIVRGLLADRYLVLAGLMEELADRGRPVGTKEGPTAEEAVEMASNLDLRAPTKEPVHLVPTLRRNGKLRWVYTFGLLEAARQRLLHQVSRAAAESHPAQFNVRGRAQLETWFGAVLPNAQLVITTDIPDCFNRIRKDVVGSGLPFSGQVMKAALFDTKGRAKPLKPKLKSSPLKTEAIHCSNEQNTVPMSSPQRGIPQGSAFAQDVSDALIKEVLEAVEASASGVHAAAWGDNLIFVLKDASVLSQVQNALTSAVQARFGVDVIGELIDRIVERKATVPFFFCGRTYRFTKGKLRSTTPEDRIDNFGVRLEAKIADALQTGDPSPAVRSLSGWLSQNRDCPKVRKAALRFAAEITDLFGIKCLT